MIALGSWAEFYEGIPKRVKVAAEDVDEKGRCMINALDQRLTVLYRSAQCIQKAVDQLEGAPQAIVDRFPSESMAQKIAARLDARFAAQLPR